MNDVIAPFKAHNKDVAVCLSQSSRPKAAASGGVFTTFHQIRYTVEFAGVRTSNLCITGATKHTKEKANSFHIGKRVSLQICGDT